jgi:glycosyltransferase involved in cell wall biosynthesis
METRIGTGKVNPTSAAGPLFSIIIPVHNDWIPLEGCLRSLAQQESGPSFEVIVVDDGSRHAAPAWITNWSGSYPVRVVRQARQGVSAARNRGARIARGAILVFVDADCRPHKECLAALQSTIAGSPGHDCFQLRLTGDCSTLVGRAEALRLLTLQTHMLQPDGRIRYLNTSGFALRRARVRSEEQIFEPGVHRGEDTLFLAQLMERGELPLLASQAVVQHVIHLSLPECLIKDVRSGFLAGRAHREIALKGLKIRVSQGERVRIASSMWRISGQDSIGRAACLVLLVRQGLERMTSVVSKHLWRS